MPEANELRLDDGFSTTIELENVPGIKLYEKGITPPSISGGGPIATTTMRNLAYRTQAPKRLKALGPINATCAYATDVYPELFAQIGVNQRMTIRFADGAGIRIWGWLEEFTPGEFTEGEQPTAAVVFQPSLRDNNGVETGPEYLPPGVGSSGT